MKITVESLSNQLVASYERVGGINHLDGKNLPSKTAIAGVTGDLLRLLFPGFFDEMGLHSSQIKAFTAWLMETVSCRLTEELYRSFEYQCPPELAGKDPKQAAREVAMDFLGRLPDIRELLQTDADAAYNGDPAALSPEEIIVAYPFIEAIAVQRMANLLYRRQVALIPRIMTEWAHGRTGMDLHPGAEIGSHFFIDHGTGTVIGETCRIGRHVKLYHGVTLGARSTADVEGLRGKKRHPTLEDHVTIYPGATILGGETVIGEGSTIGGNVFLMHSVPPYSLVINEEVRVKVTAKKKHDGGTGKRSVRK